MPPQINRSGPLQRKPLQDAQQTGALPPKAVPAAPATKAGAQHTPGRSASAKAGQTNSKPGPSHAPPPPPLPPRGALMQAARKAAKAGGAAAAGGAGASTAAGAAARAPAKAPAQAVAFVPSAASLQELRAGGRSDPGDLAC